MIWVKALHVIFMVTWFAGLFYLPRLFVYHADTNDSISHERFLVMERKLFAIMTIGAILTAVFGFWMLGEYAWSAWGSSVWLTLKLILVGALVVYHLYCLKIIWFSSNSTSSKVSSRSLGISLLSFTPASVNPMGNSFSFSTTSWFSHSP